MRTAYTHDRTAGSGGANDAHPIRPPSPGRQDIPGGPPGEEIIGGVEIGIPQPRPISNSGFSPITVDGVSAALAEAAHSSR